MILAFIVLLHILYQMFFAHLHKEQYTDIPIEFVHHETISVNTKDKWFDIFIRDNLIKEYDMYVKPIDESRKTMLYKCYSEDCNHVNRIEYPAIKGAEHPTIPHGEIEMNRMIKVVEPFSSPTQFHTIPLVVKLPGRMPMNTPMYMKDLNNTVKSEGGLQIFLIEDDSVRRLYDLYACKWDDVSKKATCQKIQWQSGEIPEVDLGVSKDIDMIRIVPKASGVVF